MTADIEELGGLVDGPPELFTRSWPLSFVARLPDLRPRFIPKSRVGRGHRAIARNGRVLLASDQSLLDLAGKPAWLRLQTWHKAILPGDPPQSYGLLICARVTEDQSNFDARLAASPATPCALAIAVGGGQWLVFGARAE